MCKFTFKKLISLILCGSAMNCSAAFAMDPELMAQNYSGEDSSIYDGNLSMPEWMKEDIPVDTLHIPGEEHLTTELLDNNEEHGSQNEDGQVVNEQNQAPPNNAGENGNVWDHTQAVNEEIHQTDNANSKDKPEFLNQKRNSRPDYFPNNFTDGYIWNFKMGTNSASAIKPLIILLRNDNLRQQFTESRSFAPADTNNSLLEDTQWGKDVVGGKVTDKEEKLHRRFFNKISELIKRIKPKQTETGKYHAVYLSTPFGIVKTSLLPKGKSLILQSHTNQTTKKFENLDDKKQRKALEIIRDYLAESQGGNYSVDTCKGARGRDCYNITIDNPRYNGKDYSEVFDKTELPCLRRLFFDLVYRFPNKYNDSGIFEIAYINWYLNKLEALSDEPV